MPVRILPQRFAVDRTGERMHGDRTAQPDQCDLYLELDHMGYPVAQQGESRVGDKRPDGDEEGLDVSAWHLVFYVSAGIAESEQTGLYNSNPGQVAESLVPEFVQDHAREGERRD